MLWRRPIPLARASSFQKAFVSCIYREVKSSWSALDWSELGFFAAACFVRKNELIMSPVCCCEAKEARAKRIDEYIYARRMQQKQGTVCAWNNGVSDYQKGRWPGDAAQRQRNPARAASQERSRAYYAFAGPQQPAMRVALLPATKTNAHGRKKSGRRKRVLNTQFFASARSLPLVLDHWMNARGRWVIKPLFSVKLRAETYLKEPGKSWNLPSYATFLINKYKPRFTTLKQKIFKSGYSQLWSGWWRIIPLAPARRIQQTTEINTNENVIK